MDRQGAAATGKADDGHDGGAGRRRQPVNGSDSATGSDPKGSGSAPSLPGWRWAYMAFRFGDGATHALVPLAALLVYDLPLWGVAATTAAMNLASVPASFVWGTMMEKGRGRRRLAVLGFATAAVAMAAMSLGAPYPLFLLAAVVYTAFGVATAPAASTLALEGVPRRNWGRATAALSRRTGAAFLLGLATSTTLGLLGLLDFAAMFLAAAVMSLAAAFVALRSIPPAPADYKFPGLYDSRATAEGQRWFDRAVYFPSRLRHHPTVKGFQEVLRSPARPWLAAYFFMFAGSVCFFTGYPGILSEELGLSAGMVLLAQAPSNLVTPLTYTWSGRYGARHGEEHAILQGVWVRMVALPLLIACVLLLGAASLPAILVLHAAMGLSFALVSINGAVLIAALAGSGHGQGVGAYHAALGSGTLFGSLSAFLLLRFFPSWVASLFAVACATVGMVYFIRARRGHAGAVMVGSSQQAPEATASAVEQAMPTSGRRRPSA